MAPLLGYWSIRGLAEQIRLLLRYLDITFEENLYKCGPAPEFDISVWLNEKYTLGMGFPNLPYYFDGTFKITQSGAILEYIADINGMIPDCKKERARLHMLQLEVADVRSRFSNTCYNPDFDKMKADMVSDVHQKLKNFEAHLNGKLWLNGDKINYPDFNLCELLNVLVKFDPKFLENYPNLQAYLSRFESLPQLKDYMKSEEFQTRPCNDAMAMWRGDR